MHVTELAGPTRRSYKLTFALLALPAIVYALLQSLVVPALTDIQHALHTSVNSVSWVLTGYLISAAVATPLIGRLGDMYGKKRVLIAVLVVMSIATSACAVATTLPVMVAGRFAQGTSGGIYPLAFGIIRDEFPRERVAWGVGLMSALVGIGAVAGVVLAGPIVDQLSFHYLFWLPLVLIVLATVSIALLIPESPVRMPGHINWMGAVLMSLGLTGVLLAITQANDWHWLSAKTLMVFAAGVTLLALWVRNESASESPLVDMRMMRIRGVWTTNLVALLIGVGSYSSFVLIPELAQAPTRLGYGFGASVSGAGLFLVPATVTTLITAMQIGRLEARFGSRPPLLAAMVLLVAHFAFLLIARDEPWQVYCAAALLGGAIGLGFASMINLIIENVDPAQTGVATGMNVLMRTVGGAVGASVTASILASNEGLARHPSAHGYSLAFAFCLLAALVGAIAVLWIPNRRPEDAFVAVIATGAGAR
jgi:MFS family permease